MAKAERVMAVNQDSLMVAAVNQATPPFMPADRSMACGAGVREILFRRETGS
jgi:hypothetical protein